MWDVLKPTDLEQAQGRLNDQRADVLRRHAEEMAALQADEADLETLDRLAAAFSSKFKKASAAAPAPVSAEPEIPPVQHRPVSEKPELPPLPEPVPPRAQPRSEKRNLSGTNFEVFSRAVAKSGF